MRLIRTMGVSVTALALATTLAGTATASSSPTSVSSKGTAAAAVGPSAKSCFSNLEGDTGVGIVSQNFESSFDIYDAAGADDVTITGKCKLTSVTAPGAYFNGVGPARDETVTIYKDKKGKPGKVVTEQTVAGADNAGSFQIPLKKTKLKKGTYWVSVVANLDFAVGGEWGWENTSNAVGDAALWQNPGGGFGSGCDSWGNMQSCLGGVAPGPDFMLALN